jgi:hypothetical protein
LAGGSLRGEGDDRREGTASLAPRGETWAANENDARRRKPLKSNLHITNTAGDFFNR